MLTTMDMQCAADFGLLPECDCPHEHWHIGQACCCLDVHFEADGSCHVLLLADGDEDETHLQGLSSIERARPLAMAWAAPLIGETFP